MHGDLIAVRYRLLDRHASGGMATVWRARDEWTREIVAVKRLHPYVVTDPAARARLEREAIAMRAVDHPAIVRPRELVEDPDAPSLVMDFVEGRPLDERIAGGPLPPGEAVAIASVVADALAVAHDHGIVHRDIKPGNILVDDDGAVHLIDFGIAALMGPPDGDLTSASTMVGTLRYAAPERLLGDAVTPRTDVWALGAVLYEMLTGSPAVATADLPGALDASRAAPPSLDGLPAGLAPIVARAMSSDPAERYADAAELREAMLAAVAPPDPDAVTTVLPVLVSDPAPSEKSPESQAIPPAVADPVPFARGQASADRRRGPLAIALAAALGLAALAVVLGSNLPTGAIGPSDPIRRSAAPLATPPAGTASDPGNGKGSGKGKDKGEGQGGNED
jgi:eukaryotic-like serine/threonine-protein kinase